jgi:hypothetical protein
MLAPRLRTPSEQIREGRAALVRLEPVLLVNSHPRQLLPLAGKLVAAPGQLLLRREWFEPGGKPLLRVPIL